MDRAAAAGMTEGAETRKAGLGQGLMVVLAGFLPILAIVALSPAVPRIAQHFAEVPNAGTLIPLIVTAPGLMIALFSPVMGWLADRYGRRLLLVISTLIYGAVGIAPLFFDSLPEIFASRLALGLCEAAILTVTNTLLGDYFDHDRRRTWLTLQGLVGPIFGTSVVAISGFLTARTWNASFLIYAVAFPIFLATLVTIYEPPAQARSAPAQGAQTPFPWLHVAIFSAVTLFASTIYYVYIVQVGLAFSRVGVTQPDRIGLLISLASIGVFLGAALFQWLSGRCNSAQQILVFLTLLGAGLVGIGFSPDASTMTGFAFVQQLGAGISIPALVLWAISRTPAEHRGRGMGCWTAAFFLGQFTSPLFFSGAKLLSGDLQRTFAYLGGIALLGALVALRPAFAARR